MTVFIADEHLQFSFSLSFGGEVNTVIGIILRL